LGLPGRLTIRVCFLIPQIALEIMAVGVFLSHGFGEAWNLLIDNLHGCVRGNIPGAYPRSSRRQDEIGVEGIRADEERFLDNMLFIRYNLVMDDFRRKSLQEALNGTPAGILPFSSSPFVANG
jgi:hypothetical protein